ncbi:MAG: dihydrodipicolinate synthase family protein [Actinomycetota bacterium]|nr:dihydrodipicolinate synthase family protein [Actinomycetota bacterium]
MTKADKKKKKEYSVKEKLSGVFAPIVTPFENEEIIFKELGNNILKYNMTDLKGYMPLGSNGEYQGLTEEESLKILDVVQKYRSEEKIIVAGCGRESAKASVEFIKKATSIGLDFAFVLTPHYFVKDMSDDALFRYFTFIADKSPIPVVIYNAPKFAFDLLISPELMRRLSVHPNIIAMKNSSLFPTAEYKKYIPENCDFYLLAGNVKTFYHGLIDGAIGAVLSTASYLPEYCCKLYQLYMNANYDEAEEMHKFLNDLSGNTVGKFGVPGVKFGMELRGFFGGEPRLPLLPLKSPDRNQIVGYFDNHGITKFDTQAT